MTHAMQIIKSKLCIAQSNMIIQNPIPCESFSTSQNVLDQHGWWMINANVEG